MVGVELLVGKGGEGHITLDLWLTLGLWDSVLATVSGLRLCLPDSAMRAHLALLLSQDLLLKTSESRTRAI